MQTTSLHLPQFEDPTRRDRVVYRVLVVDDNEAIHGDVRKILAGDSGEESGLLEDEEFLFQSAPINAAKFEIDSAFQGQEGLEMVDRAVAEGRPYALAFVDIRMPPGWDGIETVSHLWKSYPELQVVICTAYSDYSWNDMIRKLGHSDSMVILKKPFDNIELIQLAHALTRKWTVSREARAKRRDLEMMVEHATAELRHYATHDSLTNLPNRRLFSDRLEQAIAQGRRHSEELALLYIDLDGFKVVNDTLGHALGDKLLCEVVGRMRSTLRECDTLARMGGDEFLMIAGRLSMSESAQVIANRVRECLQQPFLIENHSVRATASIGISIFPTDGDDVAGLLRSADAAMYEAKRRGRNCTVAFTPEIGSAMNRRAELETSLRDALERRELRLHYQPEFDVATQRLVRFEALLRWQSPIFGHVEPEKFIPIAEECGLIWSIGNWVIEEACMAAKKWSETGCCIPVAVNVSAHQFYRTNFVETVREILQRTSLGRGMLELELTETAIAKDVADLAGKIRELDRMGIGVVIDDFGSGYSSLSYLTSLPVVGVKVDRSFVESIDSAPRVKSIMRGMIALAHTIGLRVVVEGVETAAQLEALIDARADEVQGYFLGRPAPLEQHLPRLIISPPNGGAKCWELTEKQTLIQAGAMV